MLIPLYIYLGIYSACGVIAQQTSTTASTQSSSVDLTAASILNDAITTSSTSAATSSAPSTFSTSSTRSETDSVTSTRSTNTVSSSPSTSSGTGTISVTSSAILSTSSSNVSTSTSSPSPSSEASSDTSEAQTEDTPGLLTQEQKIAIALGAVIGGIAILMMFAIFWCAFCRGTDRRRSYIHAEQPIGGSARSSRAMQAITGRTVFSRGSGNAPEVLRRSGTPSSKSQNRTSSILQTSLPNTSEKALALDNIQENPQQSPETSLHSPPASTYRPSGEARSHGTNVSHYQPRSLDIMDVASSRYSSDGSMTSRNSPFQLVQHPRGSGDLKSPRSPPLAAAGRSSVAFHHPFRLPPDGLKSPERQVSGPYFPTRNQHRSQVALVHYPSWSALSEFDSDHFDESDGQQGSKERPSAALSRRSGNWKRGSRPDLVD